MEKYLEKYFDKYDDGFLRGVMSQTFKDHPLDVRAHVQEDNLNTYTLNSRGYRSAELTKNAELVVAGCSFTFGSGVSEERSWGSLVAQGLGLPLTNLGVSSWSTQAIIYNLFAYFKEYGNPKRLLCLFPDDSRALLPMVRGAFEHRDWVTNNGEDFMLLSVMIPPRTNPEQRPYSDRAKYSKQPHDWEDILPVELITHNYFQNIHMLQSYCDAAGIEFIWSTWYKPLAYGLESPVGGRPAYEHHGLSSYLPLHSSSWEWDYSVNGGGMVDSILTEAKLADVSCHSDLAEADGDNFYIGSDGAGKLVHWGSHKHAHIAEKFIEKLKNGQNLAE